MQPQIPDERSWHQAELLMQPAFIRLVDHIRQLSESSPWESSYEQQEQSHTIYLLHLTQGAQRFTIDFWGLCYRVCFQNYDPSQVTVTIDQTLLTEDGQVHWSNLDHKTQNLINAVFANPEQFAW
jgi:hypothetical protein